MLAKTAPFAAELEQAFPERPFSVRFWDGTSVPSTTQNGGPTFQVNSPKALAHILRAPGELGLGRAYVQGLLDVDDIDAAIDVVDTWRPPRLAPRRWLGLAGSVARATGLTLPPPRPTIELRLKGPRHSLKRDRAEVRYHYDAGNEFFALFLDDSMTYSCAVFSRGAETLEEAQETKLELVCSKLGLSEGMRVLDVGCGWGSFALHAAERHGAEVLGITLSKPQAALARERVHDARLEDRVEIQVRDYRDLKGERFDATSSIGLVQHAGGERLD